MKNIYVLTKRHMAIFFADKGNILFTCLSSIIVIALYVLFMFDSQVDSLAKVMVDASRNDIVAFMASWLLAGQITLIIFGATFNALTIFIDDMKYNGSDIQVFPMAKWQVILTYCIQAVIIALIFAVVSISLGAGFIWLKMSYLIPIVSLLKALGIVVLGSIFSSMFAMFVVVQMKTVKSFGSVQTVLNTIMGFLIGMYMPIGVLPEFVQKILPWNPYMSLTVWLRDILAGDQFEALFGQLPEAAKTDLSLFYGMKISSFETIWSTNSLALFLIGCTVALFGLLVFTFSKRKYNR